MLGSSFSVWPFLVLNIQGQSESEQSICHRYFESELDEGSSPEAIEQTSESSLWTDDRAVVVCQSIERHAMMIDGNGHERLIALNNANSDVLLPSGKDKIEYFATSFKMWNDF